MKQIKTATKNRRGGQRIRIIGGQWRGRQVQFADLPDLRPTPDRVRETAFNWLLGLLPGACCLDLFAGSGALGFEAASRGADAVVMVDQHPRVIAQIKQQIGVLGAEKIEVVQSNAFSYLQASTCQFDVVFLDPPYSQQLLGKACALLDEHKLLKPGAYIYMETDADDGLPELPAGWQIKHSKRAGHVGYHLVIAPGESQQNSPI